MPTSRAGRDQRGGSRTARDGAVGPPRHVRLLQDDPLAGARAARLGGGPLLPQHPRGVTGVPEAALETDATSPPAPIPDRAGRPRRTQKQAVRLMRAGRAAPT